MVAWTMFWASVAGGILGGVVVVVAVGGYIKWSVWQDERLEK
ncbi:MAG: hypothetical protein H6Q67_1830 [Firmicutes bacterium]|nr:hypothetical protein [Bacillota bacterium]